MITAAQLRAARGLLDWTRQDLAKASGVSTETVKNIEHGTFRPQETTSTAIIRAFAAQNVEFTADEGVRKCTNSIINYVGKEAFRRYADDVYAALLQSAATERTIYIFGNDDKEFVDALGDYADTHLSRMAKLERLYFKALVTANTNRFVADYIEYRTLPNTGFNVPFSVYGDRFDFIMYGTGNEYPKVVVIKSQAVADAYRQQFNALWELSREIKK